MVSVPISEETSNDYVDIKGRTDAGEDTLERFRYQITYTAILAIEMYSQRDYIEIFCEHHEDVILVLPSRKLVGIQIKTRDLGYGAFSLTDSKMQTTIINFIKLDSNNPNRFDKFVILSNCGFSKSKDGIDYLLKLLKESDYKPTREVEKILNNSVIKNHKKNNNNEQISLVQCISVFKKLECKEGPGFHDIHEIAVSRLKSLTFNGNQNVIILERIVRRMIEIIFLLSSKKLDNIIPSYCNILDKKRTRRQNEINSKRLSILQIDQVLKEYEDSVFLKPDSDEWNFTQEGSIPKMIEKMTTGNIEDDEINIIASFFRDAQNYMISESHKYLDKHFFIQKIEQVRKIILNVAIESKPDPKLFEKDYGVEKLRLIERKLEDLTIHRREHIHKFPYEILKGMVGILTSDCSISFTNKNLENQ